MTRLPISCRHDAAYFYKKKMRRIIVTEFITLDGVVEAPGGNETDHPHGGWQSKFRSAETGAYKVKELASVDALLLGRKTYEQFAGYWPNESGEAFADPIKRLPKYVVSTTLQQAEWNNSQVLRNVEQEVAALRNAPGGDILVYGSATLVKSLLRHNLVDELRMMVYPVSVGGGLKLFGDDRGHNEFQLVHSQVSDNGVLILEYRPSRI